MSKIEINKEKCTRCGACIKDCIAYAIEGGTDLFPQAAEGGEDRCIGCTHCMAVCPTGAISVDEKSIEEALNPSLPNPDDVLGLIQSRRSIRQYKNEEISPELFDKLKAMLPYIPTGCNTNTLHFSFVETKSAMDYLRTYVRTRLLKIMESSFMPKLAGKFVKYKTAFENGEDVIFRGAPHMVVVSSHIHAPCANVDPIIALSYIELYANSLGLGTCWCGFAQACFKLLPRLSEMVQIPDEYKPVYVMLLGHPAVKYKRTTIPDSFPVTAITEIEDVKMGWTKKARRILLNFIRG